ncbi:hypothetical protein CSB45_11360 [candidate division KSB3 bacterium]|uniref:LysM domain-containing protein n=1 Tax=candidate division KSB3 bacterium TaxID=2044937 RepID=A0A2G6E2W1_9BACT|nr:MAG: hypothetical protein CSB45_11360 [candidate division KSB3 bacterium]PIE28910.1 MAG: hypothetical protein CSA57_11410 [candidate division KSB3 bacterium]
MKVYTIRSGDSLFQIARKFYGDGEKYRNLASYNGLSDPDNLRVGMKLRLPDEAQLGNPLQGLKVWHNYGSGTIWWRNSDNGIEVKGQGLVESAKYAEQAADIWQKYQTAIITASEKYSVAIPVIIATVVTESSGDAKAYRHEAAFYRRYIKKNAFWKNNPYYKAPRRISSSYGLMQIMYTTAYAVGFRGTPEDLYDPAVNIDAGAAYMASAFQVRQHGWDPPKIACAYNAGSVRPTAQNRWGMYYHPGHLDRWIPSYNAALKILKETDSSSVFPSKPHIDVESDIPAVVLRFVFPPNEEGTWKPVLVDLFKHEERGLGDPASFTLRTATATDHGYSSDLPNIAKGRYDIVFSDARSGSVFDDRANVLVSDQLSIVDLTSPTRSSRRLEIEKSILRFVFAVSPPKGWTPVLIDLFKLDEHEEPEPITIKISTPPPKGDVPYVHTVPDIDYGRYDIDCTEAESLMLLEGLTDVEVSGAVVSFEVDSEGIRPLPTEKIITGGGKARFAILWEKIKAFWIKYW